jgi:AraC-like DNA-binding protein
MVTTAIVTTTDVDQFRRAIRPISEVTITGRGRFSAKVIRIDLQQLWMTRARESLPRIWHVEMGRERTGISFSTEPGPAIGWRGAQIAAHEVIPVRPGLCGWHRLFGPTNWGAVSLPDAYLAEIGASVAGRNLLPSRETIAMAVPPAALARLRRLHAEAARLAENHPKILASPGATHGLEQALVEAMLACLRPADIREDAGAFRHHAAIIKRFRAMAEARTDQAVFLPEVCAAIGVSGRTLRICCQEQLGISPKRYLLLRRLHLAQRSLRDIDPAAHSVTEIATRFGFWELGRFSVYYKDVFGESPSATLRRAG